MARIGLDGYGLPGRIARHTSPAERRAGVGAYSRSVGNSALGTRTIRLTLTPTVGTCEGRASGFATAGGDDGDDGGATRSGTPDEEHAADRDRFEPKL
jgi:hypothetical protein